ncbi:protein of unknown function [Terribacillus aidingensis]|uniref:DUF1206 domain-containing protein n=1 Tax=Terribacillus aidingensis TaxID=586416 RepID=A0A285P6G0_9BACI|nr:DUF1206 domain-containing protein [Terribacillus aidingensis]SNZ17349.1 protein of unknown function [Terribacillus aidingensis]
MTQKKEARQKAKEEVKPWIRRFGRFGYMSQGIVYALIGILALLAALHVGGKTTNTGGMLQRVATFPFGNIILWLIGIGLIGYVCWVAILAIKDPNREGNGAKGIIIRIGYGVSAIIYGSIAFNTFRYAATDQGSSGGSQQSISAQLLSYPLGKWLIAGIGVIIIGYGIYEIFSGITGRFMNKFNVHEMNKHERRIGRQSGLVGLVSRGVVFGLIGFFFILTSIESNPDKAKGLDGALAELAQQPFGRWLLGIVALGFILFGLYSIIRGRYQQMSFGKHA